MIVICISGIVRKNLSAPSFWKQRFALSDINNYYKDIENLTNLSFNPLIFGE